MVTPINNSPINDAHPSAKAASMQSRGTADQHMSIANTLQNVSQNISDYKKLGHIGTTGGHVILNMPWNNK